ncbi:hypothetical protein NIES2101_20465 [Calothrix sp. HK-06]|nr:hypothetical protein NIES2101_20465 [Calothrix sp. HK-06]
MKICKQSNDFDRAILWQILQKTRVASHVLERVYCSSFNWYTFRGSSAKEPLVYEEFLKSMQYPFQAFNFLAIPK